MLEKIFILFTFKSDVQRSNYLNIGTGLISKIFMTVNFNKLFSLIASE